MYKLIELLNSGVSSNEAIKKTEEYIEWNSEILFIPRTVEGLIKGGRISKLKGSFAKILKIKPILVCYTKIVAIGKCTNYKVGLLKIINLIKKDFHPFKSDDIEYIGVLQTASETEKEKDYIIDTVAKAFNFDNIKVIIRKIPNVILTHVWDGCFAVAIAFKNKQRKRNYLSITL
jgi:fatty acid-binding protein DegV